MEVQDDDDHLIGDEYPNPAGVESDPDLRIAVVEEFHHTPAVLLPALNVITYPYYVENFGSASLNNLPRETLHALIHEMQNWSNHILTMIASKSLTLGYLENFFQQSLNPQLVTYEHVVCLISKHMASCLYIFRAFKQLGICQDPEHGETCSVANCIHCNTCSDFAKLSARVCYTVTVLKTELVCWLRANQQLGIRSGGEDNSDVVAISQTLDFESGDFSAAQRLILTMLQALKLSNYKRYQGSVYQEIYLVLVMDLDGNETVLRTNEYVRDVHRYVNYKVMSHYSTHSWEPHSDVKDYVYRMCDKGVDFQSFMDLTKIGIGCVASYLTSCVDHDFPELVPQRMCRSFPNGVLDLNREDFYVFSLHSNEIPGDMVCTRHYETPFPYHHLFATEWFDVPTPCFNKILRDQKLNHHVRFIFFAFLGRLLYPLQHSDNWQVILFIKGVASSGKSTIGNVAKAFYKPEDVAIMSSNIEGKFGLDAIVDKLLYICFEVTKSWGLPRSDFQSIIVGEGVSIAGKHKTARTVEWNVPGLLLGNELGPWEDSGGSMVRRLLVVEFNHKIFHVDTEMDKKLAIELPAIIYKSFLAYHILRKKCQSKSIWEILPKYFTKIQKEIAIATNPIKEFLMEEDEVTFHPSLEVARTTFDARLRTFLASRHTVLPRGRIDDALKDYKEITIERKFGLIEGRRHHGVFLLGIGLKNSKETQDLEAQIHDDSVTIQEPDTPDGNQMDEEQKETMREDQTSTATALVTARFTCQIQESPTPNHMVVYTHAGPPTTDKSNNTRPPPPPTHRPMSSVVSTPLPQQQQDVSSQEIGFQIL